MKLNHSELKSFFVGTLLGDSYIHKQSFCCKQISKDLILFKAKIIKKFLPGIKVTVQEMPERIDKNGVLHQKYWQLTTSRHRYISKLQSVFYPNGKKIYPKNSVLKLTALGFAMWYADDGTTVVVQKGKMRRVQLCTDCFTKEECLEMQKEFSLLKLTTKLVKTSKGFYRIQINTINKQKFICALSDYFYKYFPSLLYKMDLGYRNEQLESNYVLDEYKKCYLKISAHPEFKDRLGDDIV